MIELRNRGRYSTAVKEEFQHFANRIGTFLGQIFDQDGNFIRPEQLSMINYISPVLDLSINNGFSTGQSQLPQTVNPAKAQIVPLGQTDSVPSPTTCQFTELTSTHVFARRTGTNGNANVSFQIVEYR